MADPARNPFADIAARTTSNQGVFGQLTEQLWGKPVEARKAELEAIERQQTRADQRAATAEERKRTDAMSAREREATLELFRLGEETRSSLSSMGNLNPSYAEVIRSMTANPKFARNALGLPAEKIGPVLRDIVGMTQRPDPAKPVTVGEGAALVNPETGAEIFKNEKPPEESGRTKAEQTELAKRSVGQLEKITQAGQQARMDELALNELESLGGRFSTGAGAVVKSYLGRVGIDAGNLSDIQAYEALVDRMVPGARQGLPGSASNLDVQMFKSSLPNLLRTPEGNKQIIATLKAANKYRLKQAEIAESVFDGSMTLPQGLRELRKLPSPLERFKASQGGTKEPKLQEAPVIRLRRNPQTGGIEEFVE